MDGNVAEERQWIFQNAIKQHSAEILWANSNKKDSSNKKK